MPTHRQPHRFHQVLGLLAVAAIIPVREAASQDKPVQPTVAVVSARLDSLEKVALNDTTPGGRLRATAAIANVGEDSTDCANRSPSAAAQKGVVRRLASIYWRSHDAEVRRSILGMMVSQAECDDGRIHYGGCGGGAFSTRFGRRERASEPGNAAIRCRFSLAEVRASWRLGPAAIA